MSDFLPKFDNYSQRYKDTLNDIRSKIKKALKDYPNYITCSFIDVGAKGISITGNHKEIKEYGYPCHFGYSQVILDYDLLNAEKAIEQFISDWKKYDNDATVKEVKYMLDMFAKYGCD